MWSHAPLCTGKQAAEVERGSVCTCRERNVPTSERVLPGAEDGRHQAESLGELRRIEGFERPCPGCLLECVERGLLPRTGRNRLETALRPRARHRRGPVQDPARRCSRAGGRIGSRGARARFGRRPPHSGGTGSARVPPPRPARSPRARAPETQLSRPSSLVLLCFGVYDGRRSARMQLPVQSGWPGCGGPMR
jgi:hypothetical protein